MVHVYGHIVVGVDFNEARRRGDPSNVGHQAVRPVTNRGVDGENHRTIDWQNDCGIEITSARRVQV